MLLAHLAGLERLGKVLRAEPGNLALLTLAAAVVGQVLLVLREDLAELEALAQRHLLPVHLSLMQVVVVVEALPEPLAQAVLAAGVLAQLVLVQTQLLELQILVAVAAEVGKEQARAVMAGLA